MRYLINRKTNEHERYDGQNYDATKYRIVEADDEGWIKHESNECPLPEDVLCDIRCADGSTSNYSHKARQWGWLTSGEMCDITHYKPILEPEKAQEPEPIPAPDYDPRSVSFNLLKQLEAAHEAAQVNQQLLESLVDLLKAARGGIKLDAPELSIGCIDAAIHAIAAAQQRHGAEGEK